VWLYTCNAKYVQERETNSKKGMEIREGKVDIKEE
jgi:hypothetical protein